MIDNQHDTLENKSGKKGATMAKPRQFDDSSGVQEGCNDGVSMVIVQTKAAELADTVRLCSDKVEESRGTPTRVIHAQQKMAEATKTLGFCSDKVEESMCAPIRVVRTNKVKRRWSGSYRQGQRKQEWQEWGGNKIGECVFS